jgi:DNA-directed RNA polymerase II subunit RPB3
MIIQQGITVLQRKLAAAIKSLSGEDGTNGVVDEDMMGVQSPDPYEPRDDGGYTAYANGGSASAWGGANAATPYGATPYGGGNFGF